MNNNGSKTANAKSNQNVGQGLRDILTEQSIFDSHFNDLQEHVKAARIGAAILELIDIVEAKYQSVIFKSVTAYRSVAQEETTEEIGRKLSELERQRIHHKTENQKPKRRWYYLYIR